jgi:hypothetical protein
MSLGNFHSSAPIVYRLLCLVSITSSHLDFHKPSEPAGSPYFAKLIENQN